MKGKNLIVYMVKRLYEILSKKVWFCTATLRYSEFSHAIDLLPQECPEMVSYAWVNSVKHAYRWPFPITCCSMRGRKAFYITAAAILPEACMTG